MTINYTTLLGLALPVTGTESGTWGDDVSLGITDYLDIAVAGTNNITNDSDITLSITNGSSAGSNIVASPNSTTAQYMQLLCTGSRTAIRNINCPESSKMYVVNNSTSGGYSVVIRGYTTGPTYTTGVTVVNGEKCIVFWSSVASDFIKITSSIITNLTGTLLTSNGGTGLTSYTAGDLPYYATGTALSKLGIGTNGQILTSSGTAPQWSTLSGVAVTTFSAGTTGFTPNSATSGAVTLAGTLATTNGGTGLTSFTANQVFYASSTSAFAQSSNLQFSGTDLTVYGLTVGRGAGAVSTNTAVGASALSANTTGSVNSAFGYQAGYSLTTGTFNNFFGEDAAYYQTTGSYNIAIGQGALQGVSGQSNTGSNNTAVGNNALLNNTTASNNTAVGYQALYSNTTAINNTAVGYQSGYSNTTGQYNTFVGRLAGYSSVGASAAGSNTFVGNGSGYYVSTGTSNTILGGYTGNQGGLDIRTASNYIVLSDGDGNPLAYVQNAVNNWYQKSNSTLWSITSDERIKKNVVSLETGLDVISALRPVEFDYIENDKHDIGFIAQEYQTVLPAQISEGEDGMLSLNQNLVPYLVKAIQELKAEIDSLKSQLKGA